MAQKNQTLRSAQLEVAAALKKSSKSQIKRITEQSKAHDPRPAVLDDPDAGRQTGIATPDKLDSLAAMAQRLLDAASEVEEAEKTLSTAKETHRRLQEEDVPSLMEEIGMKKLTLTNGFEVQVKPDVYCSITEANKEAAFKWLTDHEFGSLIKTAVAALFGKGELKKATKLAERLIKAGNEVEFKQAVHPGTLKAFLKEQLEKGADIPLELFGARPVSKATVKPPKQRQAD